MHWALLLSYLWQKVEINRLIVGVEMKRANSAYTFLPCQSLQMVVVSFCLSFNGLHQKVGVCDANNGIKNTYNFKCSR